MRPEITKHDEVSRELIDYDSFDKERLETVIRLTEYELTQNSARPDLELSLAHMYLALPSELSDKTKQAIETLIYRERDEYSNLIDETDITARMSQNPVLAEIRLDKQDTRLRSNDYLSMNNARRAAYHLKQAILKSASNPEAYKSLIGAAIFVFSEDKRVQPYMDSILKTLQ